MSPQSSGSPSLSASSTGGGGGGGGGGAKGPIARPATNATRNARAMMENARRTSTEARERLFLFFIFDLLWNEQRAERDRDDQRRRRQSSRYRGHGRGAAARASSVTEDGVEHAGSGALGARAAASTATRDGDATATHAMGSMSQVPAPPSMVPSRAAGLAASSNARHATKSLSAAKARAERRGRGLDRGTSRSVAARRLTRPRRERRARARFLRPADEVV